MRRMEGHVDEGRALRTFLRERRARADARGGDIESPCVRSVGICQRDVASLAGVSLSFYKRLEAGALAAPRLDLLARVAQVLGLDAHERATLVRLARPDLSVMAAARPKATELSRWLRVIRDLVEGARRSRTTASLLRLGTETSRSILRSDGASFSARPARGGLRLVACAASGPHDARTLRAWRFPVLPALADGRTFVAPPSPLHDGFTVVGVPIASVACAPVRATERLVAAIGFAYRDPPRSMAACIGVLEAVAAVIELAIDRRTREQAGEPAARRCVPGLSTTGRGDEPG